MATKKELENARAEALIKIEANIEELKEDIDTILVIVMELLEKKECECQKPVKKK